jgi:phosphohistidine phosphatase
VDGTRTLVVIRHAKSDWSVPEPDRRRPLSPRGRRQAPHVGRWLAGHGLVPSLALVSPATRARQTWDLVAGSLAAAGAGVRVEVLESVYTVDREDLLEVVRALPAADRVVALVSHNPAAEDLVTDLTGRPVRLVTSAVAVVELPSWSSAGRAVATLRYAGRPADGDRDP